MAACIHNSRAKPITNPSEPDDSLFKYLDFSRPTFSNLVSCSPIKQDHRKTIDSTPIFSSTHFEDEEEEDDDGIWSKMVEEAEIDAQQEPILFNYYFDLIISKESLEHALANQLATKLGNSHLPSSILSEIFMGVLKEDLKIKRAIRDDLKAVKERDPACISFVHCILNFKGFLACQAHRVAHQLWSQGRETLALLIQSRVSEVFAVDIHPAAKIGSGILFDHATGVVIGETAVIGNNVSILHGVTLGGTGKDSGDRHPKIGDGVLIGATAKILGNVRIGEGAKIGAGSVVLKDVPARTTAVGNPARLVGGKEKPVKLDKLPSFTMDHISFINKWSDYVI